MTINNKREQNLMTYSNPFRILETSSCEVTHKEIFNTRYSNHIPDLFFIFFFISLFLTSAILDRLFIVNVLYSGRHVILGVLLTLFTLSPVIYASFVEQIRNESYFRLNKCWRIIFHSLTLVLGLDAAVIGIRVMIDTFVTKKNLAITDSRQFSSPFFQMSNQNLLLLKTYCFMISAVKSILFLFTMSVILCLRKLDEFTRKVGVGSMLMNIMIFSLSVASIFPIRRTPKIYKSCTFVLLNSTSKFMASMCACGSNLIVFALIFKSIGYYVLLIHFSRIFLAMWLCWCCFSTHSLSTSKYYLVLFGAVFAVMFSIIYIHPFKGWGKPFYYFLHLLNFLVDVALIYILTGAENYDAVLIYVTLKVIFLGTLSCFGVVNSVDTGGLLADVEMESSPKIWKRKTDKVSESQKVEEIPDTTSERKTDEKKAAESEVAPD